MLLINPDATSYWLWYYYRIKINKSEENSCKNAINWENKTTVYMLWLEKNISVLAPH